MKLNQKLIYHVGFWAAMLTAFWGSFEQAVQAGNDPIWSGTLGFPFLHHYIIGYIILIIFYILLTYQDFVVLAYKIREVI